MLNVTGYPPYAECRYAECNDAECNYTECLYAVCLYAESRCAECIYAECHYTECLYIECHYAQCRGANLSIFGEHIPVQCTPNLFMAIINSIKNIITVQYLHKIKKEFFNWISFSVSNS